MPESEEIKECGQRIVVEGILVDVKALRSIGHSCRPETCKGSPNCCSRFQIHIDEKELETIIGFLPLVEKYKPAVGRRGTYHNVFEEDEDGALIIDADDNERCVFAYTAPRGETLCSLHSAAIDLGLSPVDAKPRCCTLWPLALTGNPRPELSVNRLALSFPCNRKKAGGRIDDGIQETIRMYFGASFLEKLMAKIV